MIKSAAGPSKGRSRQWSPLTAATGRKLSCARNRAARSTIAREVVLSKKGRPRPCTLEDISETGARIILQEDEELPERFLLLLTPRGIARLCREVWRDERTVGVEFVDSDR